MLGRVRGAGAALVLVTALFAATGSSAEIAWVKDELRIELRTGPGVQYRIVGYIKTGDSVEVLRLRSGWIEVRSSDQGDGWMPEGFLQPQPPSGVRLAQSEAQTAEFRGQFSSLKDRVTQLETQNAELSATDESQRSEIETLTRENLELRAGARWPEWITGAAILSAGMVMGAIVHSASGRRARPRIRL